MSTSTLAYAWGFVAIATIAGMSVADAQAEIEVGAMREDVIADLGEPQGVAQTRGVEILYYARGSVEVKNGKVVRTNLVSEQEAAEIKKERELREKEMRLAREAERMRLIEEGTAERERILSEPGYTNMTFQEIVDYWDVFKSKYPNVPIDSSGYDVAQQELRIEKEKAIKQAEAEKAAEKPPKPRVSGKKKKKMQRQGKWIWD